VINLVVCQFPRATLPVKVNNLQRYTSSSILRQPKSLIFNIFQDGKTAIYLGWVLFTKRIRQDHKKTILGLLWLAMMPVFLGLVFFKLHTYGILKVGHVELPHAVHVIVGMFVWQNMTLALKHSKAVVARHQMLLKKKRIPWEAFLIAVFFNSLLLVILQIPIIAGSLIYYKLPFTWPMLMVLLPIISSILISIFIGTALLPLITISRDLSRLVDPILGAAFFATPIVYQAPANSALQLINNINPVTPFLNAIRATLAGVGVEYSLFYISLLGASLAGVLISFIIIRVSVPIFIERMGS
jgi:lipopolysaccharide transport system permease protein